MELDNYLVFGAPQESGPSGGVALRIGGGTSLAVSVNTTLQKPAELQVQINELLLPPEKET